MKQLLLAMTLLILLSACAAQPQDHIDWYNEHGNGGALQPMRALDEQQADDRTSLDAEARLRSYYGLDDMTQHRMLLQQTSRSGEWEADVELQMDFDFPADAEAGALRLARQFVPRKFVYGVVSSLNPHAMSGAYDELALEVMSSGGFGRALSQILLDGELILQEEYTGSMRRCYENSAPVLPQRSVQADWIDKLVPELAKLPGVGQVDAQQALLGNTLLIQLRGDVALDPESLQGPMALIERAAATATRPNNVEQLNDGLYPLLVLELYRGEERYHYSVYVNFGEDRGWREADWMNYDFSPLYGSTE